MNLKVIVHSDPSGGFWAEVPALPGCVSQGETMEEMRENISEAISAWIEAGQSQINHTAKLVEVAV